MDKARELDEVNLEIERLGDQKAVVEERMQTLEEEAAELPKTVKRLEDEATAIAAEKAKVDAEAYKATSKNDETIDAEDAQGHKAKVLLVAMAKVQGEVEALERELAEKKAEVILVDRELEIIQQKLRGLNNRTERSSAEESELKGFATIRLSPPRISEREQLTQTIVQRAHRVPPPQFSKNRHTISPLPVQRPYMIPRAVSPGTTPRSMLGEPAPRV
jgi:phage shock protein A